MADVPQGLTLIDNKVPKGLTLFNNEIPEGLNLVQDETVINKEEPKINNVPEGLTKIKSISKEQELIDLGLLPPKSNPVQRILTEPFKDIAKLFEGGQFPEREELGDRKANIKYFPVTENGFLDIPKMYKDAGSVKEFTKDIATHVGQTFFRNAWWIGETTLDVTFAPIVGAIGFGGQAAEEIVLEALGEEGFQELEKNIFNSDTLNANNIKEHIEEVAHILLANTISKGHQPSIKSVFKNESRKVDKQITEQKIKNEIINNNENAIIIDAVIKEKEKGEISITDKDVNQIKEDLIIKEIKEKIEPYLEDTKNKLTDYVISEIIEPNKSLTIKEKLDLKQNFNNRISEKITKSEQPNYVSNINEIRNQSFKNKNIQPTKSDFFNTFNYQGNYRPLKGGSYLKIKERYGAELFDQYTGKRIDIASKDFGNNNLKFDPTLEIKNQSNKKPISRQEILQDFLGDIGVPIRSGRIKSETTQGFYMPITEQVRTKFPYDLGTAAHEIGHWINGRFPEITKKYFNDPIMKEELKSMGYDYLNPQEGFADFVNFYLNKESIAKEYAPKFYEWFDSTLKSDKFVTKIEGKNKSLKKAVLNAQKKFSSYWKQGNINRIKSKIGVPPAIDSTLAPKLTRLRQEFIDNLTGIQRFETNLGNINTPIYKKASALRNGRSLLNAAIQEGMIFVRADAKGNRVVRVDTTKKSLEKIIEPISDRLEDWGLYFVSVSAKELKARGKEKLFTTKEIESGIALAGKDKPRFDKAIKEYQEWNKGIIDFAEVYGELFTKEDVKNFQTRSFYLPFFRVNKDVTQRTKFQGGINEYTGVKSITGGTSNLKGVIENIVGNAQMFIESAIENRIKLDVLQTVKESKLQGSERFVVMKPLPPSIGKAAVFTKDIKNKILDSFDNIVELGGEGKIDVGNFTMTLEMAFDKMGDFANLLTIEKKPKGINMVMPVMEKGKLKYYEVSDPLLFDSLSQLSPKSPINGVFVDILRPLKKIGQSSITLSFDFMTANAFRGEIFASIITDGYVPFRDGAKGLASRIKKDQNYQDFMVNGLDMSNYYLNEGLFLQKMKPFYDKKGINVKNIATSPLKFFRMLEELGSSIEKAARIQVASNRLAKTKDLTDAVYLGKDNLVDFGMRGSYNTKYGQALNWLNETVMFLRPAILGLDRTYRGFVKSPNRKSVAIKTGVAATASATLAVLNSFNPLYQQLEDWDKDTNWHIFFPTPRGMEYLAKNGSFPVNSTTQAYGYNSATGDLNQYFYHWRMPKIWEIGSIMSVAERGAIAAINNQKNDTNTFIQMAKILGGNFRLNPMPQGINPLFEQLVNYNFFTGRQVVSDADKGLPAEMQGFGTTSLTSQKLGELTGMSPSRIEALWKGYFSTLGTYGLTISDQMFFDNAPDLSINQYPFFNRFTKKQPLKNTKYTQIAYDMMADINKVMRAVNESANRLKPNKAKKYITDNLEVLATGATELQKDLSDYNTMISLVKATNSLEQIQKVANGVGKILGRNNKIYIQNLIDKEIYNDIGALKTYLTDDLLVQRNFLTEKFVKFVENKKGD